MAEQHSSKSIMWATIVIAVVLVVGVYILTVGKTTSSGKIADSSNESDVRIQPVARFELAKAEAAAAGGAPRDGATIYNSVCGACHNTGAAGAPKIDDKGAWAPRLGQGKDGLIKVEVDDKEPAFAAQLANAHVEELRKLLDRLAVTEAQQRRMFYEKQLEQTKAKLAVAQQALQRSGINEGALRAEPKMAAEAYAGLKAAVTAAQVKLQSMRTYLTDQSPEFKLAQSELGALQAQLSKAESANNAAASDDYIVKYRDFKYQESLFEMFAKQFELAKLDEARDGALIQVVDVAQPPERKSKPKKAMIAVLTTVATGFLLLLFVFIRQAWRNGLQDEATAQKLKRLF